MEEVVLVDYCDGGRCGGWGEDAAEVLCQGSLSGVGEAGYGD